MERAAAGVGAVRAGLVPVERGVQEQGALGGPPAAGGVLVRVGPGRDRPDLRTPTAPDRPSGGRGSVPGTP